ncbi:MAG: agmatine deiminase family protein [Gammaproteobacteria bacterium]|jgi:agmatine deiminase|nr:agmatine deiminase family protein [Gammaproteobacteria bacterium]
MRPDSDRYFLPPEWATHQGTWFSWPHNAATWPDCLEAAERAVTEAVVALATAETVRINVFDEAHRASVAARFIGRIPNKRLRFHVIPTNDAWCRDHGAIFVIRQGRLEALDFRFNAWGGKYPPWDLDDAAAEQMSKVLGVPCERIELVLEGGSVEVNGDGVCLTTEQCLLNPNRNPSLLRGEIEQALRHYLGVRQVIWLGEGIAGDDTDGHIDDLTRFVAEDTVVTVVEPDPLDVNHAPLQDNLERLRAARLPGRKRLRIVEIPMPPPQLRNGERLPASYANFYIGNGVVLMPAFDDSSDPFAAEILARCFPSRRIVPIDARALVAGLGTFHCLTQQIPAHQG